MSEQRLVNEIKHYLNAKGHFVWRNNSGVTRSVYKGRERMWRSGVRGGSDIIGLTKNGKFLAIECKVKPNKATAHQKEFLDEVLHRGGLAFVAYELADVEVLERHTTGRA